MAKKVRVIPATLNKYSNTAVEIKTKRKTAGYARVSTDSEEQGTSYEAQMSYYKNYIESRDDLEFVGMYSDEGISATNTKHREGFNKMIADAMAGKIELIITKSVSRFARNTVDSLQNVRKLKENGVEIYFEKENIWTFDSKGELLITIMSSLAQEESRSISENTTWGKRKQFEKGKGSVGFSTFLGYDKDFKINEEQANVVKLIYKLFISGLSFYGITQELMSRGIKSPAGKDKWYISTVKSILTNEKYRGDALLQKQYTVDFLQKTRKKNNGEIPQYYVEEHHEAIIRPEQFDFVQYEINNRYSKGRYSGISVFSNKLKCGCCGGCYGSKIWHSNSKYRKVVYRCNNKYKNKEKRCNTPNVTEAEIKNIFIKSLNKLVVVRKEVNSNLKELIDILSNTDELQLEADKLKEELIITLDRLEKMIKENARTAQDQSEYMKKENAIREIYNDKYSTLQKLEEEINDKNMRRRLLERFIKDSNELEDEQIEFDSNLWNGLVDYVIINNSKPHKVVFKGGFEIEV